MMHLIPLERRAEFEARFWVKVEKTRSHWYWRAFADQGYGKFGIDGKIYRAHRVAYALIKGQPEEDVLHSCDIGLCVKPAHLFEGDDHDNVHDCMRKDRRAPKHGLYNGNRKLNEDDVRKIRRMFSDGVHYKIIAERFEISWQHVYQVNNSQWRHLA